MPFTVPQAALLAVQVLLLFLASTVVFDVVHWLLHVLARSRVKVLQAVGALHDVHHRFLDEELRLHRELIRANITHHVIPEFVTQISVSLVLLALLPTRVVVGTILLQALIFLLILRARGMDINHKEIALLRAYRPLYFCVPAYHALHHVWPEAYFSSWVKTLDHVLGSGVWLAGRRVAMVGSGSEFGAALRGLVEVRGVRGIEEIGASEAGATTTGQELDARLQEFDVLVVADVGAAGGTEDAAALVERFREATRGRKVPAEVWAVALEAERDFAAYGRRYFFDPRLIYRHVVVPAPSADPQRVARRALFWILRGFNYVPAKASPRALLSFLHFRFFLRPAPRAA